MSAASRLPEPMHHMEETRMPLTVDRRRCLGAVVLAGALVASARAPAASAATTSSGNGKAVSPAMLAEMLQDRRTRVIDVRPRADYRSGHIPGAFHLAADDVIDPDSPIPGAMRPEAELAAMFGRLGVARDSRVVLYDDQGGFHAGRLFWMLEYLGHREAAILDGGLPRWRDEGRPVTRSGARPDPAPARFTPALIDRRFASADWLMEKRNDPEVVVIDVRPAERYRAGHIPWALSIPWKLNLTEDGVLKPAEVLLAHFAAFGVTPGRNIATHCQDGKASGHTYWVLRALGFPRVRSYDRSWAEWGAADDLPKATG